jgi:hypothetical protein
MKKITRLTESDLTRIVKRVINEKNVPQNNQKEEMERKVRACLSQFPMITKGTTSDNLTNFFLGFLPDAIEPQRSLEFKRQFEGLKKCLEPYLKIGLTLR